MSNLTQFFLQESNRANIRTWFLKSEITIQFQGKKFQATQIDWKKHAL